MIIRIVFPTKSLRPIAFFRWGKRNGEFHEVNHFEDFESEDEDEDDLEEELLARALRESSPLRWGKRSEGDKRAPLRWGKRAPSRYVNFIKNHTHVMIQV